MPMTAAGAASKFTLAANNEAALTALVKNLRGGEPEFEFEHDWLHRRSAQTRSIRHDLC